MVNEDYIDVRMDIFEYEGQRARVQKSLTIAGLKDEILREFDDIPADMVEDYAIYMKGMEDPLDETKTLIELDIQPQDELVFDHLRSFIRQMLPKGQVAYLMEETSGKIFEIQWQPAIIGRPSTDIDHNIVLAVNLKSLPDGNYISRRHAEVLVENKQYYLRPLAEYNPVFLNGKKLSHDKKYEIKNGDKLTLGPRKITLFFRTEIEEQKVDRAASLKSAPISREKMEAPQQTFIADPEEISQKIETPNLMILSGMNEENLGKFINLDTFPYLLGRSHPLLSSENFVSRIHAEISRNEETEQYYLKDLDSTNGVTLDGNAIPPNTLVEIDNGSRIGLGNNLLLRLSI